MPNNIETRLKKLEEQAGVLRYQNGYSALITKDDDGVRWYSDSQGNSINEKDADPDLIPPMCIVIDF